jgi:hypothetical protein
MKPYWEEVESGLTRASIPGGWLVRQYESHYDPGMGRWEKEIVSICFVPDPDHVWDVSNVATTTNKGG